MLLDNIVDRQVSSSAEVTVASRLADPAFPSKDAKGRMYDGVSRESELWDEAAYESLVDGACN